MFNDLWGGHWRRCPVLTGFPGPRVGGSIVWTRGVVLDIMIVSVCK